jgi:tetratricopeptide (TPR) repeat protein
MELFELYLSPIDATRFKVIVTQSPVGEGETESSLPFCDGSQDRRITLIKTLESASFRSESFVGEGEQDWMVETEILAADRTTFHPDYQARIGKELYHALFPPGSKVERALHSSLRQAEAKNTQLLVQLKLEADAVQRSRLSDYPWELLHDGQRFLLHHQLGFSRYIAHETAPPSLPPVEQVNVLLVSSAAFDSQLGLKRLSKQEQQAIRKGLEKARDAGHICLRELEYPTFNELRTYLTENRGKEAPHVLHFDGHGLFGKRCQQCGAMYKGIKVERCKQVACLAPLPEPQGYLVFEDEEDEADYISAKELGTLLHQTRLSDGTHQTGGVALVVLSACQSGMAVAGESVFNGTAQNLIGHRVPAVVAMQYSVSVEAATSFAEQFYRSLGQKDSLTVAVNQGREAMGADGNQWYRPVLYLRWRDNQGGQLFATPTLAGIRPEEIPSNLPRSGVIQFVGRDEALKTLHEQLQQKERVAICAIAGMGGVGKTELALQYAQSHQQQGSYPGGLCWLQAAEAEVGTQIISFARVQLDVQIPDGLDLQQQVAYCWQHWRGGEVLLVLDDVRSYEKIKPYLPPAEPRFKVLITTRRQGLGESFELLRLEVLSKEAAIALLVSFVGEERIHEELDQAKQLCAELGYLPLGLELVGRYLKRKPDLSLAQMRQLLGLEHRSLQQRSEDMTAGLGVAAAFELSWQELDELAQQLACLLSLFALAPITWSLVEQCLPDQDSKASEDARDEALLNLSLLERRGQGSYQLHQLIREFMRSKLAQLAEADQLKRGFCQAMVAAAREVPETPTLQDIATVTPLIPHLAEVATFQKDWLSDEDLISPFAGLGRFYSGQGAYEQALPWYEQCVSVTRERLGEEHPSVATSLNNLAVLYYFQGRYAAAEPLYLQALKLRKRLLGEEHPHVASSLNNLALLYSSQGRYTQAEPLYLQALELSKRLLGEEHPHVALSLNNLANLYYLQRRYAEAEPLYLQALKLRKRLLGEEHPDVAASLNNLALLYSSQGRYTQAEPLYLQALELWKRLLGEEHPSVASSLNNLASLYESQGRYTQAEPLYLQALKLRKRLLGQEHPDIATSLNNLAGLYKSQGRYTQAEPLYLQALELSKRLLGEEHPSVATSLNNLAGLYDLQGRYAAAEPLFLQALELFKRLLGQEHPSVATSLNNLALLYYSQRRYAEAEPLFLQALELSKRLLGQEHPDVASSLNNLANVYYSQGRYAQAEPLYLQTLELSKRLLGQEHPDIAISLHNLANLYHSQGRYAAAELLFLQALEITERQLGVNHPNTSTIRKSLQSLRDRTTS